MYAYNIRLTAWTESSVHVTDRGKVLVIFFKLNGELN